MDGSGSQGAALGKARMSTQAYAPHRAPEITFQLVEIGWINSWLGLAEKGAKWTIPIYQIRKFHLNCLSIIWFLLAPAGGIREGQQQELVVGRLEDGVDSGRFGV